MTNFELRASLDQLIATGLKRLRRYSYREAVQESLGITFYALGVVPLIYLCLSGAGLLTGSQFWSPSWIQLIYLSVACTAVIFLAAMTIRFFQFQPDKKLALALFDRQLGLKDSLQIADEFLDLSSRTAFQDAALNHAAKHINEANRLELAPIPLLPPKFNQLRSREGLVSGVLLFGALLVHFLIPGQISAETEEALARVEVPSLPDAETRQSETETNEEIEIQQEEPPSTEMFAFVQTNRASNTDSQETVQTQNEQKSQSPQVSTAAEAVNQGAQSSTSQQSSGFKSEQKDLPQNQSNKVPKPSSREKKSTPKKPPAENENSENQMSGMSKSGSSNKVSSSSTSDNDYKTKDNPDLEEPELEADDEEDEEQESGASSKPMLDQRKAPADRQLTPSGAGQQEENPDANGRSGAGGLKKTRGVAAKLLGVPMPDQLTGHTNPGRMKINRKNANPNLQPQDPGDPSPHGEIDQSIGSVPDPKMSAWMRQLIQNYFTQKRTS